LSLGLPVPLLLFLSLWMPFSVARPGMGSLP
jgi:hypothetical protein